MSSVNRRLAAHPLFTGLPDTLLADALCGTHPWKARRGAVVFTPDAAPAAVILCLEGRLISTDTSADGRHLIYELVQPGECDGVLSIFGRRTHHTIAAVDSEVALVNRRRIEALVAAQPSFGLRLAEEVAKKLEARERRLTLLGVQRAKERIALHLLELSQSNGSPDAAEQHLDWDLTHQQLADMLGVRRETTTVALGDLQRDGVITHRDRRRVAVSVHRLRTLISTIAMPDGCRPAYTRRPRSG